MKKIFALILALCLLCGMTALADDSNRQTELKATVEESYTIVILTTLDIAFNAASTELPVQVKEIHMGTSIIDSSSYVRKLQVKIDKTSGNLVNKNDATKTIAYTISPAQAQFAEAGTQNFAVNIADAAWKVAAAGNYSDIVTFTTSIVETTNKPISNDIL